MIKKFFNTFILFVFILMQPCYALDFDVSVDEEIRKNYNPSKLEIESLPPLPKTTPSKNTNYGSSKPVNKLPALTQPTQKPVISQVNRSNAIRLPFGTKFKVKSLQAMSDSTRTGTRVSFSSMFSINKTLYQIPAGTVFHGVILDSHTPQITGNGGLIVLKIDSMNYKGRNISLNAKITKVNSKHIFINNIKGKHTYWKNVAKQVKKGDNFYKKSRRASAKLSGNPIGTILSPIPTIAGIVVYTVNLAGSPVIGLFATGGRLSIPSGSEFEIKVIEDAYLPY